jgi:cephalosporin hydroxylase
MTTYMDAFLSDYTDKHTVHSYTEVYERLFAPMRETCTALLEIGVQHGGSMRLWTGYFQNAIVYGLDTNLYQNQCREFAPRVRLSQANAYTQETAATFAPKSLDIVIDDGPHTLESMLQVIALYLPAVRPGGYLIIEDIQSMDWLPRLRARIPHGIEVTVEDRRSIKGRYDDVLLILRVPTDPTPAAPASA